MSLNMRSAYALLAAAFLALGIGALLGIGIGEVDPRIAKGAGLVLLGASAYLGLLALMPKDGDR